jgi:hypothetical protein
MSLYKEGLGKTCISTTSDTWRTLPGETGEGESARQGPGFARLINVNTRMHYIIYFGITNE